MFQFLLRSDPTIHILADKSQYLASSFAVLFVVPLVGDDGELDAGGHIENTHSQHLEMFAELVKSKNYEKRQRSQYSPYDSFYTV